MYRFLFCAFFLVASASSLGDAESLRARLADLEQLSGRFQQGLVNGVGDTLERSSGEFAFLRPSYLRWHIVEPEEQLLVAVGESFWLYDVELETVTRRPMAADSPYSPMAILSGDIRLLEDYYAIEREDEHVWLLTPLFPDAEFEWVRLRFDGRLPVTMAFRDRLGRVSNIIFAEVDAQPGLSPDDFNFVPPEGVDLYVDEP